MNIHLVNIEKLLRSLEWVLQLLAVSLNWSMTLDRLLLNVRGNVAVRKKTTPRDDAYLIRQSKTNPRKTSDALNTDLKQKGIEISSSTVRRRLLAVGRRARRPVKKQLLTKAMKEKRYKWAKKYKDWTKEQWRKVIFSDESHFLYRVRGASMFVGHQERRFGILTLINVLNTILRCFGDALVNMVSEAFIQLKEWCVQHNTLMFFKKRLVPELEKRFPDGSGIYQQDLAPCHTSKIVKNFMTEKNIQVLDWPGNSPDVSPIENLWAICKSRLRTMDCTSKEMLIQALIQVWYRDPKINSDCSNLVDSMPNRVQMFIKNRGGHIRY